jgi:site-specific recombinase XerD
LNPIDGYKASEHPIIKDLFKGFTNARPREYKIPKTWKVTNVTTMLQSWGSNRDITTKQLTYKATMLMALASGSRCSELAALDQRYMRTIPEGIAFQLTRHKKNSRSAEMPGQLFIGELKENQQLCPCACIKEYLKRTKEARVTEQDPLLRTMNKAKKGVSTDTVSRWLTDCIRMAGIDVKSGKAIAHSTRSVATSEGKRNGMCTRDIMKAAG